MNSNKTNITIFHTQQNHIAYPDVIINNSHVEIVDDFKLLRITINKYMKYSY